jgi:hypothetical protein
MSSRCAYKDGKRRCSRNGFGEPPLCRMHALQLSLDGQEISFDEASPAFSWLDAADRILSRSNNEVAKQAGALFGEFLSASAERRRHAPPPPPNGHHRPPPPPRPNPADDPRLVLGFEPGDKLTAEIIKERKKALAALFHPDRPGGSLTAMKRVNEAADKLLCSL